MDRANRREQSEICEDLNNREYRPLHKAPSRKRDKQGIPYTRCAAVVEENGRADFAGSPRLTKVSFTICQLSERKGLSTKYWGLAQLVARQILTLKVIGSSPISPA